MASPKISSHQQRIIEIMLENWSGKLTWEALTSRVGLELGLSTTRQTLCSYSGIASAFKDRKAKLRGVNSEVFTDITASDVSMLETIKRLRAEIVVLKRNNSEQLRMIERIFSNANSIPNLDLAALIKRRPEETPGR